MRILNSLSEISQSTINKKTIFNGFIFLSNQLAELEKICELDSYEKKYYALINLKDPDNKQLLTSIQVNYIIKYKLGGFCSIKSTYSDIIFKIKRLTENQVGGSTEENEDDKVENYTQDEEDPMMKTYESIKSKILYVFNWIFFPAHSIETVPVLGNFASIYLDILTSILNFSELFWGFLAKFFPPAVDTLLDLGGAIPGVGSVISIISIPLNFLMLPMQYMIANMSGIMNMFLNISRKYWGLAYLDALEVIPFFSDFMDISVTTLFMINKNFSRFNQFVKSSEETIATLEKYSDYLTESVESITGESSDTSEPDLNPDGTQKKNIKKKILEFMNNPLGDGIKGTWGKFKEFVPLMNDNNESSEKTSILDTLNKPINNGIKGTWGDTKQIGSGLYQKYNNTIYFI